MAQTTINIRMDEELKKQAEYLFSEFGMNMSTAVTIFVKTVVRERKIPFEIAVNDDAFYSEFNQVRIQKSIEALKSGKGTIHELIEAEDK